MAYQDQSWGVKAAVGQAAVGAIATSATAQAAAAAVPLGFPTALGAAAATAGLWGTLGVFGLFGLLVHTLVVGEQNVEQRKADLERDKTIAANNLAKMESAKTGVETKATDARQREADASLALASALSQRAAGGALGASFLNQQQARIETLAENLAAIDKAETAAKVDVDLGEDPAWKDISTVSQQEIDKTAGSAWWGVSQADQQGLADVGDLVGDWLGKVNFKSQQKLKAN